MKGMLKLVALLMLVSVAGFAQPSKNAKQLNLDDERMAIDGYDPVAYFKSGKAVKGKASFAVEYNGARYQFSNQTNKDLFLGAPASYTPQYGGWCAYAMGAKGEKVEIDPETFKITDGKLYLFYNRFFNNTLESWNENETSLKTNADKNWNAIVRH